MNNPYQVCDVWNETYVFEHVDYFAFNVYCILSFRVPCLFAFNYSGVYAMGGGLKKINHYKKKYDTNLSSCNFIKCGI